MSELKPTVIETKNVRLHKDGTITYEDGRTEYIDYGATTINGEDYDFEGALAVVLPDSVTAIDEEAFWNCESLTDITIPKSVTKIGEGAFAGCKNLTIHLSAENVHYKTIENNLYSYDCDVLLQYIPKANVTSLEMPDSVREIASGAFYGDASIEDLIISESVEIIGDFAFFNCKSLKNVKIPYGAEVIGASAFELCDNITSINIPASVKEIGKQAFFRYGDSLKDIYYGGSKADWKKIKIGEDAFPKKAKIHYDCK